MWSYHLLERTIMAPHSSFIFAQHGVGLHNIAIALGHLQPPTPILSDNHFPSGWPQTPSNR
jgi:hypothetical protein